MCVGLRNREICHCCCLRFLLSLFPPVYFLSLLSDKITISAPHPPPPLQDLPDFSFRTHNWICASIFQMRQDRFFDWLKGVNLRGIWLGSNWIWGVRSNARLFHLTATITPLPPTEKGKEREGCEGELPTGAGKIRSSGFGVGGRLLYVFGSCFALAGEKMRRLR